jgi:hypothetical protein
MNRYCSITAFHPIHWVRLVLAAAFFGSSIPAMAQSAGQWKAHDMARPRPPVITPGEQQRPVAPPSDAVVLFDGSDLSHWRGPDGSDPKWIVGNGYMESVPGSGYLFTAEGFGDVQLHVEWAAPIPAEGQGQGRGNSGVFLMGLYEVQVLDSFENDTYPDGQAAAIYGQYPPLVNASLPPGKWQSYDIVFRRPRFRPDGSLHRPARLTVFHNGVLVQDAVEAWGPTSWLKHAPYTTHPDRLPLSLQDHGNPVRYRNIWLRVLPEGDAPGPAFEEAPALNLPHRQLAQYEGRYAVDDEQAYSVRLGEFGLMANFSGSQWLELVAHSPSEFSLRHTAGKVVFALDEAGHPTGLDFQLGGEVRHARRSDE